MSNRRKPSNALISRIVVYWTLFDSSGQPIRCELCRTTTGLQLRCAETGGASEVTRMEQVDTAATGMALATRWKVAYLNHLRFTQHAPARQPNDQAMPASLTAASTDVKRTPRLATVLDRRARHNRGGDLRRVAED
jgi:hypothetical protein